MSDYPKPVGPTRAEVLATIGEQGMDRWRNPFRISAVKGNWPNAENGSDYDFDNWVRKQRERISGTQVGSMAEKGKPIE